MNSKNLGDLTFDINRMAGDRGIESFNIKNRATKLVRMKRMKTGLCSRSWMEVRFTADFNQFASLLNALERHRPVVFVDKFSM